MDSTSRAEIVLGTAVYYISYAGNFIAWIQKEEIDNRPTMMRPSQTGTSWRNHRDHGSGTK